MNDYYICLREERCDVVYSIDNNKYAAIFWRQRAARHCEFFGFEEN